MIEKIFQIYINIQYKPFNLKKNGDIYYYQKMMLTL